MKRAERLERRLEHLDDLAAGRLPSYQQARNALALWVSRGREIDVVRMRAAFIERDDATQTPAPASLLINSRGHALRMALLVIFLAQTKKHASHILSLPLKAGELTDVAWSDLIVSGAKDGPGSASRRIPQKRAASARYAIARLAEPDISLVQTLDGGRRVGRFDEVRLLQDSGPRQTGDPLAYSLPHPGERVVDIPVDFFLKGWIFVLEDTEIATYLMYRLLCAENSPAHITAARRERVFGIKTSAWEQYWVLVDSGLLHLQPDPNRRADGTVADQSTGAQLLAHRFTLTEAGLGADALSQVWEAIDGRSI